MTEITRQSLNAGDMEEILCGPLPHDLPEDAQARRRIIKQFEINRLEFIRMVETILSTKEKDEREDEALQRAQRNMRLHGCDCPDGEMAPNKAPGLDGITAGVLRKAWGQSNMVSGSVNPPSVRLSPVLIGLLWTSPQPSLFANKERRGV
ncbi:hypothetical protein QTP88_017548 [Uroleucon formosanum]